MTPAMAARELLAAHDDYDRVNAEHRAAVDAILTSKEHPFDIPHLWQRQTEVAKALSLARNRLETAKGHGRMIAAALLEKGDVE